MSRDKLLVAISVLLIIAALSMQSQLKTTGKAAYELAGTFQTVDEAPKQTQTMPNSTVKPSQNSTVNINLSAYFKEPNRENMTYSYTAPASITASLDNSTGIINLTIQQGWKGRANVTITAHDSSNNNLTGNDIQIVVREINITKSAFDSVTDIGWYEGQSSGELDINSLADGELGNSTEIVIEKHDYGKILFAESISITQDTNLDANINISDNYIELDSAALPNFDKKATLWFYNLTFTNPRIMKDGAVCPAAECAEINYSSSSGILIFNVTGFTAYSAEETPAPTPEAPSGDTGAGGGGGRGRATSGGAAGQVSKPEHFETDADTIKTDVKQNRVKKEIIKLSNPTDKPVDIEVSMTKDISFVHREDKITIAPGETKDLELTIAPTEEDKPDAYITQLVLKEGGDSKIIKMLVNVQTVLKLLDMEMDIYSESLVVKQRENLLAGLRLFNLGESKSIDVRIDWFVKDFNNNILLSEAGTVNVETQTAFVKKMYVPSTIEPGEYVLVAIATYSESSTVASSMFKVAKAGMEEQPLAPERGLIVLLVSVIAALLILIIILLVIVWREKGAMDGLVSEDRKLLNNISEMMKKRRK